MKIIFLSAALLIASTAHANRSVMEQIPASNNAVFVDTINQRVDIGTISYTGGITGVALFVSSKVVISSGTGAQNNCIIYSTGSMSCLGVTFSSGTPGATGPAGPSSQSTVTVRAVVDNLLASVTGSQTAFTLTQSPASTSAVHLVLDGLVQYNPTDYTLSGTAITMVTAPAANSSEFYAFYDVYTSTFPGVLSSGSGVGGDLSGTLPNPTVLKASGATLTVSGPTTISGQTTIDASSATIDGGAGGGILVLRGNTVANGYIQWQTSAAANKAVIGSYFNNADSGNLELITGGTTRIGIGSAGVTTITNPKATLFVNTGTNGTTIGYYGLNVGTNQSCNTTCATTPSNLNASSGGCIFAWTSNGAPSGVGPALACANIAANQFCACLGIP
jgi:hypothetical protein